jgi:hypothetical protein
MILLLVGVSSGAVIYGLYDLTNSVNELNNVQPANCTIVDAQVVSGDGSDSRAIHIYFTIPPAYDHHRLPGVNETHVSLLGGTNVNSHYFVNETLPCLVSMRNLRTVALTHQAADGGAIFSIFALSVMAIPICFGVIVGLVVLAAVVIRAVLKLYELGADMARESVSALVEIVSREKPVAVTHVLLEVDGLDAGTAKVALTPGG